MSAHLYTYIDILRNFSLCILYTILYNKLRYNHIYIYCTAESDFWIFYERVAKTNHGKKRKKKKYKPTKIIKGIYYMCASYKERLFFAILLGQSHLELLLVHVVVGVVRRTPDLVEVLK